MHVQNIQSNIKHFVYHISNLNIVIYTKMNNTILLYELSNINQR